MKRIYAYLWLAVWLLAAFGCQAALATLPTPAPPATRAGTFTPFQSATPAPSATLPRVTPATATPLPPPTATPRTHVVKAGEDMSGIALRYRVSLEALKAANPKVNPRLMPVGTLLVIPESALLPTGAAQLSATPQPVSFDAPACWRDAAGGAWCFVTVRNPGSVAVFNLTTALRLVDAAGKTAAEQAVSLGLDLLPAGARLPLAAYFPAPLPDAFVVGVSLLTALPAQAAAERYPGVSIIEPQMEIAPDGQSADVRGKLVLPKGAGGASLVRWLVVAYDAAGQVTGVRRAEQAGSFTPESAVAYNIRVYAAQGGKIGRAEVFAEAMK